MAWVRSAFTCHWLMTALLHCFVTIYLHPYPLSTMSYSSRIMHRIIVLKIIWNGSGVYRQIVWPLRSADMNTSKHIWEMSVRTQDLAATNTGKLWTLIKTVVFRQFVESKPHRIAWLTRLERALRDYCQYHNIWHVSVLNIF